MASSRLTLGATRLRLAPKKRIKDARIETFKNWKILRGDNVQVLTGRDAGQKGIVVKVIRSRNTVVVEGLNLVKKHIKGNRDQKGGIITKSMPIHVSNLALVHPQTGKPTRVKRVMLDGTKVRVTPATDSSESVVIPRPDILKQRKRSLPDNPGILDTPLEVARAITFTPPDRVLIAQSEKTEAKKPQPQQKEKPQGLPITPRSHWLRYFTLEHVPYYLNSKTQETTWFLPGPPPTSRVIQNESE